MVGTYYDKKTKTMKRGDKPALTREEAIKVWNTRPRSADNELLTYDMAEEIAEIKKLYSESPHILDFTVKSGFKLPILNILMEFINRPKSTDGDEVVYDAFIEGYKIGLGTSHLNKTNVLEEWNRSDAKFALSNPNKGGSV